MPDLPAHMKTDNWDFFVEAKSGDPTHKIPGCENLVENLIASVKIVETNEYDDALKKCLVWSGRAHYHYYVEHDVNGAIKWCNAIMQLVTPIIYESGTRFAAVKVGSFKYTPEGKNV